MLFSVPPEHLADPEYQKEHTRLRLAVADVTLGWASLESHLCVLLAQLMKDDIVLAGAIFFTPTSLDARIGLVDSAFGRFILDIPPKHRLLVGKEWQRLMKKINE